MNEEFEKDELLAELKKSARAVTAPKLDVDLLYSSSAERILQGPRNRMLPRVLVSVLTGATVLAGVSYFTFKPAQHSTTIVELSHSLASENLIVKGDSLQFTSNDETALGKDEIAAYGKRRDIPNSSSVVDLMDDLHFQLSKDKWSDTHGLQIRNIFLVNENMNLLYNPNSSEWKKIAKQVDTATLDKLQVTTKYCLIQTLDKIGSAVLLIVANDGMGYLFYADQLCHEKLSAPDSYWDELVSLLKEGTFVTLPELK